MPKRDAVYFIDGRRIRSLEDFSLLWAKQYRGPVGILVAIWMPSLTV